MLTFRHRNQTGSIVTVNRKIDNQRQMVRASGGAQESIVNVDLSGNKSVIDRNTDRPSARVPTRLEPKPLTAVMQPGRPLKPAEKG